MASGLYDNARDYFLRGNLAWASDPFRAVLIDTGVYAVNLATHDAYNDVDSGARVQGSGTGALTTGFVGTNGTADANDVTLTAVTGSACSAIIIRKHNATESLAYLICYIDSGSGLPVTPNGGDITIAWNASGIFKL